MPITKAIWKCSSGEIFTSFQRMKQKKMNLKLPFQYNKQESRLCQVRRGKDGVGSNLIKPNAKVQGREKENLSG